MKYGLTEDWKNVKELVIYGFGKVAHDNLHFFKDNFHVVCIVDGNIEKCGVEFKGIEVKHISKAKEELRKYKIVIMTANRNAASVGKDLDKLGLQAGKDYCSMEQFLTEWFWHYKKKVCLMEVHSTITSRCTLKCKHCNMFMPYYKEHIDYTAKDILEDLELLFRHVDYIVSYRLLGGEPVRDAFGRVSDLKLIPSAELGRPRIDVVVQTSGQLRDLAASRLFLINRAVEMAAGAKDDKYENQVATSVIEAERVLTEKGLSPKDAREISTFRIFGGINGMYGTGIQEMVESGDRWENESELATTYLNNMGAYYGSEKNWEVFQKFAFEAALTRTDVVVQPRQSNTWGALSLDHVYEFMGGMNLAVRNVTGKDPDAYLSDYRNRNNMKMQELKEAVGVESRTTILNPVYIKEKMKGGASSASEFAEVITNTYGWNVMKPAAIDKELWDNIYNVYVKDELNLGVKKYFEQQNPAALEEMTAVMLESARKGLWKASEEQVAELSKLHTEIVNNYRPSCSGFVCDNAKLRDYIASKADTPTAAQYKENISKIREAKASGNDKGVVMKKEEMNQTTEEQTNTLSNVAVGIAVIIVLLALILFVRKRRKSSQM